MTKIEAPDGFDAQNEPHDLTHSTILERIPGKTPEEQHAWLIDMKTKWSSPRVRRTPEDLQAEFPKGSWQDDPFRGEFGTIKRIFSRRSGFDKVFITEGRKEGDGSSRRIFDVNGHEIERYKYRNVWPDGRPHAFDTYWRTLSEYDDEGYLVKFMQLEMGNIGFIRTAEYETLADGSKQLAKWITQSILREAGQMQPGPAVGEPTVIDFRDTPLAPTV